MQQNFASTDRYIRRLPVIAFALVLGINNQITHAEFKIGSKIEEFVLKTLDDQSFSLKRSGDQVELQHDSESVQPKVLMIHFFQPECPQCHAELMALQKLHEEFKEKGLSVLGVAHRGDAEAVRNLGKQLKITFTLLMGVDSDIAKQLAAGDALGMLDSKGIVRFAQVGYAGGEEKGDETIWRENVKRLLTGKSVAQDKIKRERLRAGDPMPAIKLNSLFTEKPIALTGVDGRLTFQDEQGQSIHPKAAVGLFSRYCEFTREEMAELQKFHEKYAKDGLLVFAIAMVPDIEEARKVTRELGLTYPIFYGHGSQLGKQYAYGCPAYILDSQGKIKHTQVGFEKGDERKYETVIKSLLKPDDNR